jgi:hypothetical protein
MRPRHLPASVKDPSPAVAQHEPACCRRSDGPVLHASRKVVVQRGRRSAPRRCCAPPRRLRATDARGGTRHDSDGDLSRGLVGAAHHSPPNSTKFIGRASEGRYDRGCLLSAACVRLGAKLSDIEVAVKERSLHGPTFDRPALRMRELGICHWVAHGASAPGPAWRQQAAFFAIARCCDLQRLIRRCSSRHQRDDLYRWFRNLARLPLPSPSCSSTVRTQHNAARFLRCIRLNSKENTRRLDQTGRGGGGLFSRRSTSSSCSSVR